MQQRIQEEDFFVGHQLGAFDELKADDTMQALADKYSLTLAD